MTWQITKVFISAILIAVASWLAKTQPRLAGFIISLPIASMLALAFGQIELNDPAKSVEFARSIFFAIPLTLLFFVPFLLAEKLKWPFAALYIAGVALLAVGYGIHKAWLS